MMEVLKILIVEDEMIVAEDTKDILKELGYSMVDIVSSGEQAIQVARDSRPNLVLMDINLKGNVDGVQAAEQIRESLHIPVIYVTAYADSETLKRAKVTEPYGYILKPFKAKELLSAIEIALYRHEMNEKLRQSEQWLSITLTSIGDAVIATDEELRIVFMNPVAESLTGWQQQEAQGEKLAEVFNAFNENTGEAALVSIQDALRRKRTIALSNGTVLISKNGKRMPIEDSAAPIMDDEGNVSGIVLVFHDVTERSQREAELARYREQLEELVEERTAQLTETNTQLRREIREREEVEEALRESEEMHRFLAENVTDVIYTLDMEGHYTYISPSVRNLLGYEPEDRQTLERGDFLTPESDRHQREALQATLEKLARGEPFNLSERLELEVIHRDGHTLWCEAHVRLLLDENGTPTGILGVARDITERRRAEQALRESEEALRRKNQELIDAQRIAKLGSWWHDLTTGEIHWSDESFRIVGVEPQEVTETLAFSLIHPDDVGILQQAMEESANGKGEVEHEFRIIRPDGEVVYLYNRWSSTYDSSGKEIRRAGTHQDITARKQPELELQQKQQELANILEMAADAIISVDSDQRIRLFNKAATEVFGYSTEEALGEPLDMLIPERFIEVHRQHVQEFAETDGLPQILRARVMGRKKDGSDFPTETSVSRLPRERGDIFTAILRDVTEQEVARREREALEARVRQAQKMEAIGTLAGGIAHDFNNILMAILGYSDMVRHAIPQDDPIRPRIDAIYQAGTRARELVSQILAFSRQMEHDPQPVQLDSILKESLQFLRASLPSTIELQCNIEGERSTVLGDPSQVHQIVMNLCTNAYQAMGEEGGILSVSLRPVVFDREVPTNTGNLPSGTYQELVVADTGTGMSPTVLQRLFEPFFTTKSVGDGTGLGLSVVHGIVQTMNGTITVESEVGRGTAVTVHIPAYHLPEAQEVVLTEHLRDGKEHILVIDDEETIAGVVSEILTSFGYTITTKTNSQAALETFGNQPDLFDLVITDQIMPRMTGAELAAAILRIRPGIPIIMITGYSEDMTSEKAEEIGIRAYVRKPLSRLELARAVQRVLG